MPNSSILGRDGLYYRIPDFDEFDGSSDFNIQAYNRKMVDDLQLSDLDTSIRLLQDDIYQSKDNFDAGGYKPQIFDVADGTRTRFMPAEMDLRYASENSRFPVPMSDTVANPHYTFGKATSATRPNEKSRSALPLNASQPDFPLKKSSNSRLDDYAMQTYARAAACKTIDECERLNDQLRTHAESFNNGYATLKDSDQRDAAEEYRQMSAIASRASNLTASRAKYLATPPDSVVPTVYDPNLHSGYTYAGTSIHPVLSGYQRRDPMTGAGVNYISPAVITPWSSPLVQNDPGTKEYLADLDYRMWRFLATGAAQFASDGVLSAAFNVPRAASYTIRGPRTAPDYLSPGRAFATDAKYSASQKSLTVPEVAHDVMLPESELQSEGLFKFKHPYSIDTLPPDWTNKLNEFRMFPSQNNAEGMAQQAVKEAQKEARTGMAAAFIDREGKVTLGYSKNPRKDLGLPYLENSFVQDLINKNNLHPDTAGYRGVCAEPQVYSQLLNNNEQPWGFMGAAQFHDPTGNIRAACRNCGSVNRYFGVGYRDENLGVIPPKK
ncbi:hypothetical protein UNDKW_4258 [Undibacterium sp. KW1]|uniref:hypothetical protein n=1 Tax=Undibacterium sp. KW1 TaxID=2058624 RepID=UPI001331EFC9|nr:hypothetical protein [Undibacterium sp. KW1]BBB62531.1 hypothetical protein UNDKW_4258 [Undibacterium sp. KW1]